MSEIRPDRQTWLAVVLFIGLAGVIGYSLPRSDQFRNNAVTTPAPLAESVKLSESVKTVASGSGSSVQFVPPSMSDVPEGGFGEVVLLGEQIFYDTRTNAPQYVGNDLSCANCHIDRGRLANSAPLWAAYVSYPAYRAKNGHVNTFAERLQGCFRYSMNGISPPLGDPVLVALESYAYFLAKGAPTGFNLAGRGYPKLAEPAVLDYVAGSHIYAEKCAVCHGVAGEGQSTADGKVVFPPLWGPRSYNWGAGMSSVSNAAGFIKANMPLSQGNSLSDAEAWAVAAFVDSQERPQDPRFNGSVAETRKEHHDDPFDLYGQTVNGIVLGQNSPPFGTVPAQ